MSLKTRILLHRTGRNEFGDPGQAPLPKYRPSRVEEKRNRTERARHEALNNEFARRYGKAWLGMFSGQSKAEAWRKLCPHGRPALSTFLAEGRRFQSFERYLLFLLVSNKRRSLALLGVARPLLEKEMKAFAECGRYFVSFDGSRRMFSSL